VRTVCGPREHRRRSAARYVAQRECIPFKGRSAVVPLEGWWALEFAVALLSATQTERLSNAAGISVGADVLFGAADTCTPFVAEGEVSVKGARIAGDLSCTGGHFKNPGGDALNAEGAEFGGSVFLPISRKGIPLFGRRVRAPAGRPQSRVC